MNHVDIVKINKDSIPVIQQLIPPIWQKAYGHILTEQQSTYMMDMMYSRVALETQMKSQQFILAYINNAASGFASFEMNSGFCKIHKLYVALDTQGSGLGRTILNYISAQAQSAGVNTLRLNVNRHNIALHFYKKLGFCVVGEEDIAIGNDYFMNDYIMEKVL